jgi:hypothetical protein
MSYELDHPRGDGKPGSNIWDQSPIDTGSLKGANANAIIPFILNGKQSNVFEFIEDTR